MYIRTCREDRGGCGEIYKTNTKYVELCPQCKDRKKRERKQARELKTFNKKRSITCGICKKVYGTGQMRMHIQRMHYEVYEKFMEDYYGLMENLKEK